MWTFLLQQGCQTYCEEARIGQAKTPITNTVTTISIATEHYLNVLAVVMVMRPKVCDIICMPHTLNTKKQRMSR